MPERSASASPKKTGISSGPAAKARLGRWDGWRPPITFWMASYRAHYSRPCWTASTRPVSVLASAWRMSFAGDGNLHPNVMFDERVPGATQRVLELGEEIMRLCVDAGGSISGEHGVGFEKRSYMSWIFSEDDLEVMARLKAAFGAGDGFNPGKVFP